MAATVEEVLAEETETNVAEAEEEVILSVAGSNQAEEVTAAQEEMSRRATHLVEAVAAVTGGQEEAKR